MKYKLKYTGTFPTNNDILISCSIFKLKNPYKDFSKYIDGLKMYIEKILLNNMKIIIYYDNSIKDDENFKKIFDLYKTKILFCYYRFRDFIKDGYHKGLFGTFIRLMPIFMHRIKYKCLYVADIDLNNYEVNFNIYYIKKFIETNYNISLYYVIGYENIYFNLYNIPNTNITLHFNLLTKNKYYGSKKIFIDFLNKINNNDKDIEIILNKRKELTHRLNNNIKLTNNDTTMYAYSIDELFFNKYLIPYLIKNEENIGVIYFKNALNKYIYNIIDNNINDIEYEKIYNKIIKKIGYSDKLEYKTYLEKLNHIITYSIGKDNDSIINFYKILKLFVKYILKLYKKFPNKRKNSNEWMKNLLLHKFKTVITQKLLYIEKLDLLKIYNFRDLIKLKSI